MTDRWLKPGASVVVGGTIDGTIERVIFTRGSDRPIYLVEWWDNGDVRAREFYPEDVRERRNA